MKFIAQGIILSITPCYNEQYLESKRRRTTIDKVPLRYGSIRLAINSVELDDIRYRINRKPVNSKFKEERLILEISYKYNRDKFNWINLDSFNSKLCVYNSNYAGLRNLTEWQNKNPEIIPEHQIVNNLQVGKNYTINLNSLYIAKKHNVKIIGNNPDQLIKSYFVKAWADNIIKISNLRLPNITASIKPLEVTKKICLDKTLILA